MIYFIVLLDIYIYYKKIPSETTNTPCSWRGYARFIR